MIGTLAIHRSVKSSLGGEEKKIIQNCIQISLKLTPFCIVNVVVALLCVANLSMKNNDDQEKYTSVE